MGTKTIDNKSLRNYIKKYLEIERFGEPYATLVEEVFIREQQVLELTPEQFKEDLANFKNSVRKMSFQKIENQNWSGYYSPSSKEIVFNWDYWNNIANQVPSEQYVQMLFETVAHECLHGMQASLYPNSNSPNRAGGYNQKVKNRAHAIYEIGTQAIASKIANSRQAGDYENSTLLTGDGYSNEIFAVPLMSATFGVSEKELLRVMVRPRSELIATLNKNIGDMNKTAALVNSIENNLEELHSIYYPDPNQKKYLKMSQKEKAEAATNNILGLVENCQKAFVTRIQSTSLDFDKSMAISYKYDQKKMIYTLRQQFDRYAHWEGNTPEYMFASATSMTDSAIYIKDALNVFSQIEKDKTGRFTHNIPSIVDAVKHNDFETCEQLGVTLINREATYSLLNDAADFRDYKVHEDFNDYKQWDNSRIENAIFGTPITELMAGNEPTTILGNWNRDARNGTYGIDKSNAINWMVKGKNPTAAKNTLYKYLETTPDNRFDFFRNFTRTNGIRNYIQSNLGQETDKEFVCRYLAGEFIDRIYDAQTGTLRYGLSTEELQIAQLILPTIQRHGINQAENAFSWAILEEKYDGFSTDDARTNLAIIGKKQIFDRISNPTISRLLEQREIGNDKEQALMRAVAETEKKYPGTAAERFNQFIQTYKQTGRMNYNLFTTFGRSGMIENFRTNKDIEDMIGIVCDNFSRVVENNDYLHYQNASNDKLFLQQMIKANGKDYFRENMIKGMLYNNYSGFQNPYYEQFFREMDSERLSELLMESTTQKSMQIMQISDYRNAQVAYIPQEQLVVDVSKRKKSVFDKIKDGLLSLKNRDKQNIQAQEYGEMM